MTFVLKRTNTETPNEVLQWSDSSVTSGRRCLVAGLDASSRRLRPSGTSVPQRAQAGGPQREAGGSEQAGLNHNATAQLTAASGREF